MTGSPETPETIEPPESRSEPISYDRLIKTALRGHYADVVAWLAKARPLAVTPIDPVLATTAERLGDKLWEARFADRPDLLLHLEWQLKSDPVGMPIRMTQYVALALEILNMPEHRGKQFLSVVVYLDPKTFSGDPGCLERELYPGKVLFHQYEVVKMWEVDPGPVLAGESLGLLPLVPLMRGDPVDLLLRGKEKILHLPDTMVSLDGKQQLLAILGGLATRVVENRSLIKAWLTEVGNMSDNWFLDELYEMKRPVLEERWRQQFFERCREEARKEGREEGRLEGRVEGRVEGREEGREEAARAQAREAILRVLARRFGAREAIRSSLGQRLEGIEEIGRLETLLEEAVVTPNVEAFLSSLP